MRISDWSSDVCSSDLLRRARARRQLSRRSQRAARRGGLYPALRGIRAALDVAAGYRRERRNQRRPRLFRRPGLQPDPALLPPVHAPRAIDKCRAGTAMKRAHAMLFGAEPLDGGGVRFNLWASGARDVSLLLYGPQGGEMRLSMEARDGGWRTAEAAEAGPGTRYHYLIDGRLRVPDPASRFQPEEDRKSTRLNSSH